MNSAVPAADSTAERRSGKAALVAEILTAYVRARWLLRRATLPDVLAGLRAAPSLAPPADDPQRLARAVRRTLGALPADSRCLVQSLVLTRLLARRGIPSSLVLGVGPASDFEAHAWVELDGIALLPPLEDRFQRLAEL